MNAEHALCRIHHALLKPREDSEPERLCLVRGQSDPIGVPFLLVEREVIVGVVEAVKGGRGGGRGLVGGLTEDVLLGVGAGRPERVGFEEDSGELGLTPALFVYGDPISVLANGMDKGESKAQARQGKGRKPTGEEDDTRWSALDSIVSGCEETIRYSRQAAYRGKGQAGC
jgi:hypothetical protein